MNSLADKFKYFPQSWYPVCKSSELKDSQIKEFHLLNGAVTLFRHKDHVGAVVSHCPHMGVKFCAGKVTEDGLRCALHHRRYDQNGICLEIPGSTTIPKTANATSYPVVERAGLIFIFLGQKEAFPFPEFPLAKNLAFLEAETYILDTPYQALIFNGFDTHHLKMLHNRELKDEPVFNRIDPFHITAEYTMKVLKNGIYDRAVGLLGGNENRIHLDCWGGNILIITNKDREENILIVSSPISYTQSRIYLTAVGEKAPSWPAQLKQRLRLKITNILGVEFLKPDLDILTGMKTQNRNLVAGQDRGAIDFWSFWDNIPRDAETQMTIEDSLLK